MEIGLHAGVHIFGVNVDNAGNMAREPVFQHQLDIGTMVFPQHHGGQSKHGNGEGANVQGKGGQVTHMCQHPRHQ